ncbi:hypothetical protein CROQUDRAFT_721605 [Cronartium quercuum f. sp. fusiforme G11]|uniref:Survival protein SurE-like phosphatase/nucleotidase domain-containing protein n=1 Tax=Cronartium quercuum f. sp. fusiforme G11 TaxID=708437 RepID=A0A9P6TDM6_9BASI|nr:hypothetical protein CROQUDRAFT_721605 [Cronartium quercuum f. sp. fusiforme G11]
MWNVLLFFVLSVSSKLVSSDLSSSNTQTEIPQAPKTKLNVLLANDDGWAEADIRALYQVLKEDGKFPIISAPTHDRSATGGARKKVKDLDEPAEYHSAPAGAPGYGCDPEDEHVCYVNGNPIDAIEYGVRNLSQLYFGGPPDLALTGPNLGANIGPQAEFSGTYNAAEWAALHDIPAIALSVFKEHHRHGYRKLKPSDASYIYAKVVLRLVNALTSVDKQKPYLPLGLLLNVNIQKAGPKRKCKAPEDYKFVLTSQYGHSDWKFWKSHRDLKRCGDEVLPSEYHIMDQKHGCWASITVRMADDDKRANKVEQQQVVDLLGDLLTCP